MNLEKLKGYEVIEERQIDDLNSYSYLMRHKKTGARVVVLENDDDNKVFYIGFRTPPTDSTGVAHITEHSVLCGSKEFPVKDPFVELAKGSLNTFLNAMTYPDKTVYPVASCNDKDFMNLIHVYLDAVFYPNIYNEKKIFLQEGWHYEMEDENSDLTINGVVYNEMKGAFSSPDDVLDREVFNSLYPNTSYGVESGGDPKNIPDLTYEDFLAFHKKYYHPTNSYIYLYGDGDMAERLNWIDENYLDAFENEEVDSSLRVEEAFNESKIITKDYPISEDEDEKDNTYLTYNVVVGKAEDIELNFAFSVIEYALCGAQGTPLKQALIDAKIGTEVYSSFSNGILQPFYSITAKNANIEDKDRFIDIIENTIKDVIKNGFDKNALSAGLNKMEFKYREGDYGSYPKGLMIGLAALDSWLYDDNMPFNMVECNATFKHLRELIDTDYYEKLLEKYILNNNHKTFVNLIPKKGLTTENDKKLADKLEAYKNTLSKDEISKIVDDCKALKEYQSELDSTEALRCIPKLKREDLGKKIKPIFNDIIKMGDVTCLHHDIFTNEIAYVSVLFRFNEIPLETLPYLSLLTFLLKSVDTKSYKYEQLGYEINKRTSGIDATINIFSDDVDEDKYAFACGIKVKTLYSNLEDSFNLLKEILFNSLFEDKKRIKDIVAETRSAMSSVFMSSGHTVAYHRALSYISRSAKALEYTDGIEFYNWLCDLDDNFDNRIDDVLDGIQMLQSFVFDKNKLFIDVTCDKNGLELVKKEIDKLISIVPESTVSLGGNKDELSLKNEGFTNSSQVQYVCLAGNFKKNSDREYKGTLALLKTILGYEYLWNEVRVKGGAYGCMSLFKRTGAAFFVSYRDPNLSETLEIFRNAYKFVEEFNADEETLTKYIIGTISNVDTPLTPYANGRRSLTYYLTNANIEKMQKERDEILNATTKDINDLAPYIKAFIDTGAICVVGNSDKIKENSQLLKEIKPLS